MWIPKGYGDFSINEEVYSSECPICKKICKDVNNIGIYMALCKSKGMIKGEDEIKEMQSQH